VSPTGVADQVATDSSVSSIPPLILAAVSHRTFG